MPDGIRLSARIWLPEGGPSPAIFEYIPYRKRDMVRARDERNHPYFASHGYACLRVDMRGSGDSEGVMPDMYDPRELDDVRCVIDWIAAQPWCDGRVGMFGTSWGGTAALQAAIDAPRPLQAVIANCATIDRFEDDIHWMGGCLLTDSLEWGATLAAILACPPDRATLGDAWMDLWKSRLENLSFPFERWARNDTRGQYWRHGSVRFDRDRLACPILAIGGWSDPYSNSVMRLVRARPDLCRGIVGPWGHHYPDQGEPGPAIGFQDVALKWWDRWLKSQDRSGADSPSLQLWRREFDPPQKRLSARKGEWVAPDISAEAIERRFYLAGRTLSTSPPTDFATIAIPFDLRHGECAGDTGYFGRIGGLAPDQAPDDARALCFETGPLTKDVDLVGHALFEVELEVDELPAQIVCRICEVAPDGRSNLVVRTLRSLALDDDLEGLRDRRPGEANRYRIVFPTMAYRFRADNRIRLALGASYWPLVWPAPRATGARVRTKWAFLSLPTLPAAAMLPPSPLPSPRDLPEKKRCEFVYEGELQRTRSANAEGSLRARWHQPRLSMRFRDLGLDFAFETTADYVVGNEDPSTADCRIKHRCEIRRPDGVALVESRIRMKAQAKGYQVQLDLSVAWKGESISNRRFSFQRTFDER